MFHSPLFYVLLSQKKNQHIIAAGETILLQYHSHDSAVILFNIILEMHALLQTAVNLSNITVHAFL